MGGLLRSKVGRSSSRAECPIITRVESIFILCACRETTWITDGNIAYAAIYFDGVYKSLDAGKTWARLNGTGSNLFPTQNVGRIAFAMAPSNSSTIYAGVQSTLDFRLL